MLSKILGIFSPSTAIVINAAPGQILSRPPTGDDSGIFIACILPLDHYQCQCSFNRAAGDFALTPTLSRRERGY